MNRRRSPVHAGLVRGSDGGPREEEKKKKKKVKRPIGTERGRNRHTLIIQLDTWLILSPVA